MKSIKKLASIFLFAVLLSSLFMSCMTTKTPVGSYSETVGKEYTYAKGKQFWLFWGLVPIGRTNVNTPNDGNCEVVTKFNFGDVIISGLTGGIVTSHSIKVNAKKSE